MMKRAVNLTMWFILAAAIILKLPNIMSNFKLEGQNISPLKFTKIENVLSSDFYFPMPLKKSIAIVWATWCAPCSIELYRINEAIKAGEINKEQVFAISIDDNVEAIKKVVNEKKYLFNILWDKEKLVQSTLKIDATPTVLFIDQENKLKWVTTGVSPLLNQKLQLFLK
jgi:cytochrome c biogenesis protein CcmG/thiol:disulfide interchange protein DsbE